MNYGEQVPVKRYTSKSISDFEQEPGKDGELWGLILSDLEEAQRLLGSINYTNTSNDFQKGRVSLGTVTAYLGQAYLFYAQMKNHSEYYQKGYTLNFKDSVIFVIANLDEASERKLNSKRYLLS